jgi:hypothetical protein
MLIPNDPRSIIVTCCNSYSCETFPVRISPVRIQSGKAPALGY